MRSPDIEKNVIRKGPDVFVRKESENYIAKNSKKSQVIWVNDAGKILSLQESAHHNAKTFLQYLLKKNLLTSGIPSGLVKDIKRNLKILNGRQTTSKSIKKTLLELITTDGLVFGSP